MTATHPVRVTCECKHCAGRAAYITQGMADKLSCGVTAHGLVTLAYHPALGRAQRAVLRAS